MSPLSGGAPLHPLFFPLLRGAPPHIDCPTSMPDAPPDCQRAPYAPACMLARSPPQQTGCPERPPTLTTTIEDYLSDLRQRRVSGGATGERSYYGPLEKLFNAVGQTLKPKVLCVGELTDQGAGHPDFGLYAAKQLQKNQPKEGQVPERGRRSNARAKLLAELLRCTA